MDCVYAVPNLFLPNIDQNLFYRFMELLVIEEKLLLMFTYPRIFNSIAIKPVIIRVGNVIDFSKKGKCSHADLILANKAKVNNSYFGDLKSRIAFRVEQLEIISSPPDSGCLKLSSNELFLLLTFKTKILKCTNIEFQPTVNFHQIVEAAPALEEIDIFLTNIVVYNTWVDLLYKLKHLKTVSLAIHELNINVANLAALMEKNENVLRIHLFIIVPQSNYWFDQTLAHLNINNLLSTHFSSTLISVAWTSLTISFKYDTGYFGNFYSQLFELKNINNRRIA